jgi:biotin-(acetyl-CoA carboxylase) ligase
LARDIEGIARDIDDDGALLVRTDNGFIERVTSGDVEKIEC